MRVLIVKYLELWGQSLQDGQGRNPECILQTLNSRTNDEVKYCWEWQLIQKHWLKTCLHEVKASIVNSSVGPLTETHHVTSALCCKCTVDSLNLTLLHLRLGQMDSSPAWLLFVSCVTFVREYPPGLLFQDGWVGKGYPYWALGYPKYIKES